MAAATDTEAKRIERLEQQIDDLANIVGQLVEAALEDDPVFDTGRHRYLTWYEEPDDDDPDAVIGFWEYERRPPDA